MLQISVRICPSVIRKSIKRTTTGNIAKKRHIRRALNFQQLFCLSTEPEIKTGHEFTMKEFSMKRFQKELNEHHHNKKE